VRKIERLRIEGRGEEGGRERRREKVIRKKVKEKNEE
jgi:hypothetical protein